MLNVGFVTDPSHLTHERMGHVERPERLTSIVAQLEVTGLRARMTELEPRAATDAELLAVHQQAVLDEVARHAVPGVSWIDSDTYVTPESPAIARRAAGASIVATEAVLRGEVQSAFVAVRPPGHHATVVNSMGFCLYNNVAVAAAAALRSGLERIAIVDWDIHHGNGTQAIFEADPRVLYVSTHAAPFYPGTGGVHEIGSGAAAGTKVNIPLQHGTADRGFVAVYEQVVVPALERHRPQLVLVSSGWDAHANDPLGTLNVSTAGYTRVAELVIDAARRLCEGRIVVALEGGYDTHALAWCASNLVQLLLGETPTPDPQPATPPAGPDPSMVIGAVRRAIGLD
ncbi:MAG: histone deacetylase [Chloroflexi bacterium]|nr:MAG: histone deacetylase [Chloroflexota bacterium]